MSTAEAADPLWGSGTSCVHPDLPHCVGVRSRHVARRHGLERERWKTRAPLHLIQWDKACSANAARETAFVRPHCALRITKVHSAAACAAPAQSPSAALNGYDGTTLSHHAAYAASYTARSATWQTTPLATPGTVACGVGGMMEKCRAVVSI